MNLTEIDSLGFDEIIDYAISSFKREFGERKFNTVHNKITTSKKVTALIEATKIRGVPPGAYDFLHCVNEMPYFIFSRGQTQAVGALLALQKWNLEVNILNHMLNEEELRLRAIKIIKGSEPTMF